MPTTTLCTICPLPNNSNNDADQPPAPAPSQTRHPPTNGSKTLPHSRSHSANSNGSGGVPLGESAASSPANNNDSLITPPPPSSLSPTDESFTHKEGRKSHSAQQPKTPADLMRTYDTPMRRTTSASSSHSQGSGNDMCSSIARVASPYAAPTGTYVWREIFALWVDSRISESSREKDRGELSVEESEARLKKFVRRPICQRPAELLTTYTTIECTLSRPAQVPRIFLNVFDTRTAQDSGFSLSLLPPNDFVGLIVGLITFGTVAQTHQLGYDQCPKSSVFRGTKEYAKADSEDARLHCGRHRQCAPGPVPAPQARLSPHPPQPAVGPSAQLASCSPHRSASFKLPTPSSSSSATLRPAPTTSVPSAAPAWPSVWL
ncbi:hypothetical protein V8E36_001688 [Tilletia maclaganii]